MRFRSAMSIAAAAAVALSLAACGDDSDDSSKSGPLSGTSVSVGSKDFDEQLVLGQITAIALENAGADVDYQSQGGTEAARAALTSGEIDVYWDYTGTAWITFFQETTPITDRMEQWQEVHDRDLAENDLVWMNPALFNNTYGLAFSSDIADDLGNPTKLSDLGDLIASQPDKVTVCVENEFSTRDDGLPGMEAKYGYEIPEDNITILDTGIIYTSTAAQDPCNFGEVFTTDGRISSLGFTVLEDDLGFFPLYNAAPVFRSEYYDANEEALKEIFDPIAEALTQEVMTDLNKQVSVDGSRPEQVAEDWLQEQGFI